MNELRDALDLIARGAEEILKREELEYRLALGSPWRIKADVAASALNPRDAKLRLARELAALLKAAELTASNSEATRKLKERAVRIDGEVVDDPQRDFVPGFDGVLQVGKRNFARVRLIAC
jgi:tyrosyl-tRNA synthetase